MIKCENFYCCVSVCCFTMLFLNKVNFPTWHHTVYMWAHTALVHSDLNCSSRMCVFYGMNTGRCVHTCVYMRQCVRLHECVSHVCLEFKSFPAPKEPHLSCDLICEVSTCRVQTIILLVWRGGLLSSTLPLLAALHHSSSSSTSDVQAWEKEVCFRDQWPPLGWQHSNKKLLSGRPALTHLDGKRNHREVAKASKTTEYHLGSQNAQPQTSASMQTHTEPHNTLMLL